MKEFFAKPLLKNRYGLGESPFYDERTKTLSWVDIVNGKFYTMKDNEINEFTLGEQLGSALPTENVGEYVLFGTKGIYLLKDNKAVLAYDLTKDYESYQRSNDCKCDPMGRPFIGSSCYIDGFKGNGNLYILSNGISKVLQPNTKIANGMAWNKAKDKYYFADSDDNCVYVYDYDLLTGNISNRRVLCEVRNNVPDGMTIDNNDNIWVAVWGGKRIECHDGITGELLAIVHTNATNTTSCCFYGDNMDELFITSSGAFVDGEEDGYCYSVKVDVSGVGTNYLDIKNLIRTDC